MMLVRQYFSVFLEMGAYIGKAHQLIENCLAGWLFKMELTVPSELDELLDEEGYQKFLKESE